MNKQFQKERDILLGESEPVTIQVKRRWPLKGFKTYEIKKQPLSYGVVLQITNSLVKVGELKDLTIKGRSKFFQENEEEITRVIAYALNDTPGKEPPKSLLDMVRNSMNVLQAIEVFYFIIDQSYIGDFTKAISWTGMKLVAESEAKQGSSETSSEQE